MENTLLQRVFSLASTKVKDFGKLQAAGSLIRQIQHGGNDAAKGGAMAAILGKLEPEDQEPVVAAVEALAK